MPDKKISQLTSLAQGDIATTTDVLAIVDTSATETKKATPAAIVGAAAAAGLTNVDINSGAIDGTTIGANSAAAGTFTNLTASGTVSFSGATVSNGGSVTTVDINGGTIDGASIGASSASSGAFTTLSASGSVTLSGGTANGVLYLNGSKVATSGSALTFDGTNLGVGDTTPSNYGAKLVVKTATNANFAVRSIVDTGGSSTGPAIDALNDNAGGVVPLGFRATQYEWRFASTEAMRLTSTGLGIGTSSPGAKLDVRGNATFTGNATARQTADFTNTGGQLYVGAESSAGGAVFTGSSAYAGILGTNTNTVLQLATNGSVRATLDTSGNLGLGVTPSAWSGGKWMQFVSTTAVGQQGNGTANLMCNAYESSGNNFSYIASVGAARYNVQAGTHAWFTAPSGTAGNAISFTQAMTLDASGNLLVGTTSPGYSAAGRGLIEVNGSSTALIGLKTGGTNRGYLYTQGTDMIAWAETGNFTVGTAASAIVAFTTNNTERARITADGDLVVNGTTTLNTNAKLSVWNSSGAGSATGIATGYSTTSGQFRLIYLNSAADALNFDNGNNNASLTSGGTWTNASDARLKKNIQPIKYGLDTVLAAQPRSFNRVDVGGDYIGFIAQELQAQIPEVVYGNEGTKYSVDYGSLVAVAFRAIQEQQAMINELKAEVAALKGA